MSEKQASRRVGRVKPVEGRPGVYEVLQPLRFKAGEVISFDKPSKVALKNMKALHEEKEKPVKKAVKRKAKGK